MRRWMAVWALGLMAGLVACGGGDSGDKDTAAKPDTGGTDTAGGDTASGSCPACAELAGTAMRFTSLFVTEPDSAESSTDEAIRDYLNEIWTRDIDLGLLNIIFVIKEYDPAAGKLVAEVGPAWNFGGTYRFITGYSSTYETTFDPATCEFNNEATPGQLNFHTGPKDKPIICAPEVPKTNSIPMTGLLTNGALQVDCANKTASITGGYLSGWIHEDAADKICSCGQFDQDTKSYTCEHNPDPSKPDEPAWYCLKNCGGGNQLFGMIVKQTAKVAPQPGPDGAPSFRLAGYYSTETITNFDPIPCESESNCPPQ